MESSIFISTSSVFSTTLNLGNYLLDLVREHEDLIQANIVLDGKIVGSRTMPTFKVFGKYRFKDIYERVNVIISTRKSKGITEFRVLFRELSRERPQRNVHPDDCKRINIPPPYIDIKDVKENGSNSRYFGMLPDKTQKAILNKGLNCFFDRK